MRVRGFRAYEVGDGGGNDFGRDGLAVGIGGIDLGEGRPVVIAHGLGMHFG